MKAKVNVEIKATIEVEVYEGETGEVTLLDFVDSAKLKAFEMMRDTPDWLKVTSANAIDVTI